MYFASCNIESTCGLRRIRKYAFTKIRNTKIPGIFYKVVFYSPFSPYILVTD